MDSVVCKGNSLGMRIAPTNIFLIDDTYFTKNIKKSQSIPFEKSQIYDAYMTFEIFNVLFTFTKIFIFYCVREYLNI